MRILYFIALVVIAVHFIGCLKEDDISTDPSAKLEFSTDSVLFDTIFTSTGSVTQRIKVFNRGSKAVKIQEIKLGGGSSSNYQININGLSVSQLSGLELKAKDSLNIFVKVTINPNSALLPYLVKDSISFSTNGNYQKIMLEAFGQNAHLLRNVVLTENTVWDDKLPYVVYNTITVKKGKTLTIQKGSKVLFHKDAEMIIAGTLKVEGALKDSVVFASDRLERIYEEESGQWKGLHFLSSSTDNFINYSLIKNGTIGIQADSLSENLNPKLVLVNTIIRNMELSGLYCNNAQIDAFNNIIFNCGKYLVYAFNGGKYNFKQNTLVNFNFSTPRNTPALFFADNLNANPSSSLRLELVNNIIWGSLKDELGIEVKGPLPFIQNIKNNLIRTMMTNLDPSNIVNSDPLLKDARNYNFLLVPGSPALNKGSDISSDPQFNTWLNKDLKGSKRLFPSDLGCYEIL